MYAFIKGILQGRELLAISGTQELLVALVNPGLQTH
jgi:hypothetical protein